MKKPSLLLAVQRVVGGVEIDLDLLRHCFVGIEKPLGQPVARSVALGDLAQQHSSAVGAYEVTVERNHHRTLAEAEKYELFGMTHCH